MTPRHGLLRETVSIFYAGDARRHGRMGGLRGVQQIFTESYGPDVSMTYTFPLVFFGDNESREFVTSMNRYGVDTMLRFQNVSMTLVCSNCGTKKP